MVSASHILYLYSGAMMRHLAVEQLKIPGGKQIKCLPVTTGRISPTMLHKAPQDTQEEDQPSNAQHNHCLVSDFCLL